MISQVPMLSGIFFVLAVTFFMIYLKIDKAAGRKKLKLVLYLAVTGVLIGLIGVLGFSDFSSLPPGFFIAAQGWLLVLGILHSLYFEKIISLEKDDIKRLLFTIASCFFGYGLVFLAYKFFFNSSFPRLYFLPAFFFLAPGFVIIAFNNFIKIPGAVYKLWDFPALGTLSDPSDNEMADPIIINFEIRKQQTDSRTVFKAKAPKAMELGRLFYFFIIDYNSRHSNNPISTDGDGKSSRWSFFQRHNVLKGKVHLDPEQSISKNRIQENTTVICERIIL